MNKKKLAALLLGGVAMSAILPQNNTVNFFLFMPYSSYTVVNNKSAKDTLFSLVTFISLYSLVLVTITGVMVL